MTTTSSLAFPNMEVPAVEDSMEMASPYQGQNDDFDIDLDLMEDHVSNMDSDMMGADDYPPSQPSLLNNDTINDADMVDEPSEGSMVDVDDIADEDHDIEVQDEEVTYEAEMHEGDQDEDVDAPVLPTIQVETPANLADETNKPSQIVAETGEPPQVAEAPAEMASAESQNPEPTSQTLEPSANESGRPERPHDENVEAGADHEKAEIVEETNKSMENNVPTAGELPHVDHAAEDLSASHVESVPQKARDENAEHVESHDLHEGQDQGTHIDESLHPVKVLYQDNEISLFPPLEGDSAETFFLHDEDVAYDNVGKLFSSLREVLLDNVAENEVLVIDIDSLGIQITEDSSYTSKMTLHQILDVYLRLCHNDGTDEPEALYLTLSSKLAVHSELAGLDAAANEGKGLSQIHTTWDEFDEADPVKEEVQEAAQPNEESHAEAHEHRSARKLDEAPQEQVSVSVESHVETIGTSDAQEKQLGAGHEPVPEDHEAEAKADSVIDSFQYEEKENEEAEAPEHPEQTLSGRDEQNEKHYDSEAQKTDSTATVASMSELAGTTSQVQDASVDNPEGALQHHDPAAQDGEAGDGEDFDHEEHETNDVEEPQEFHDEFFGEEHDAEGPADHYEEFANEPDAAPADGSTSADALEGEIDHVSYDQSESTLENAPQEDFRTQEQTPEPEDDLLGIAEDLMQTPAKNHQNGQLEHIESVDQEQYPEDDLGTPPPIDEDGADDQQAGDGDYDDDDNNYPDFEVSEAIELGGTDASLTDSQTYDHLSTKRSREEEDEWEITDTTTPDTKRPRS